MSHVTTSAPVQPAPTTAAVGTGAGSNASSGAGGGGAMYGAAVAGAVVLIAVVVFLIVRRRSKQPPSPQPGEQNEQHFDNPMFLSSGKAHGSSRVAPTQRVFRMQSDTVGAGESATESQPLYGGLVQLADGSCVQPEVFFHGTISRDEGVQRLRAAGNVAGSYLVRQCDNSGRVWELLVSVHGKVLPYSIFMDRDGGFFLDKAPCPWATSLQEAVAHLSTRPESLPCRLMTALPLPSSATKQALQMVWQVDGRPETLIPVLRDAWHVDSDLRLYALSGDALVKVDRRDPTRSEGLPLYARASDVIRFARRASVNSTGSGATPHIVQYAVASSSASDSYYSIPVDDSHYSCSDAEYVQPVQYSGSAYMQPVLYSGDACIPPVGGAFYHEATLSAEQDTSPAGQGPLYHVATPADDNTLYHTASDTDPGTTQEHPQYSIPHRQVTASSRGAVQESSPPLLPHKPHQPAATGSLQPSSDIYSGVATSFYSVLPGSNADDPQTLYEFPTISDTVTTYMPHSES